MQQNSMDIPKDCFLYHPLSKLKQRDGYYPNISPAQMDAYNNLKVKLNETNITMHDDGEHEFLKTLRFLRARKFHVEKTLTMIKKDIQWRLEDNRFNLPYQNIDEVMGIDYRTIYPLIPYWRQGYDKEARPVYYLPCGKWNITEAVKLCHMKKLHRHDAWNGYRMTHILLQISKRINYNVETVGAVFDVAGLGMNMLTSDFFAYVRGLAANDSDHNPERAGWVMIINAHWVFRVAWNVIQGFVDEITKSKIMILGDRSEWEPLLKRFVDIDQIPTQYGGTAPDRLAEENIMIAKIAPVDESFVADLVVHRHLHLPSQTYTRPQQFSQGKMDKNMNSNNNNSNNNGNINATCNSSNNSIVSSSSNNNNSSSNNSSSSSSNNNNNTSTSCNAAIASNDINISSPVDNDVVDTHTTVLIGSSYTTTSPHTAAAEYGLTSSPSSPSSSSSSDVINFNASRTVDNSHIRNDDRKREEGEDFEIDVLLAATVLDDIALTEQKPSSSSSLIQPVRQQHSQPSIQLDEEEAAVTDAEKEECKQRIEAAAMESVEIMPSSSLVKDQQDD